jgi:hypothetical protein
MSNQVNDGGPAFPVPMFTRDADGQPMSPTEYGLGGMTLRDWFAGQALAGMLANPAKDYGYNGAVRDAFGFADALLKAREGTK